MSLKQQADALLQGATAAGQVPGVVAMATDRKGTLYEGAFGVRALGAAAPMTLDTVCWIASMSKALTTTAAMQLIEQGRLELDGEAGRWLPRLKAMQVLTGFDADGKPQTRAPKRAITVRHLLTHTAGFGYEFLSTDVQKLQAALQIPSIVSGQRVSLDMPLLFDPGERWEYGTNLDWLGQVVEAVCGERLGAYLQHQVFEPLGMRDTSFAPNASMRSRLANLHQRGTDGKLVAIDLQWPQGDFDAGGAGLYGTAGDYLKFIRMLLNRGQADGGRVLKEDTVALMSQNQIGALNVLPAKSAVPSLTNDFQLPPDNPQKWGLSFMINTLPLPTGRAAGSLMWAGLSNSYYWIDPSSGVGGVYLTQILPFLDLHSFPLFMGFESAVYRNRQ